MSLAFCLHKDIFVSEHEKHEGWSILTFRKPMFADANLKIALVYKQPNSQLQLFNTVIQAVLGKQTDIILGDFNIDAFNSNCRLLQEIFRSYELIVNEPTHLSGSLIDHVYVKKTLLEEYSFKSSVTNIYFSDHDAVRFQIQSKTLF